MKSLSIIQGGDDDELNGGSKDHVEFERFRYGLHSRNVVDVMQPTDSKPSDPLVVFVHGGACGSGFPEMYRLAALPFLNANMKVAVLGYRTYPDAKVEGHVQDMEQALILLQKEFPRSKTVLVGHSSGAHMLSLALMNGFQHNPQVNISALVCLAGLYDISNHYKFEMTRGVERFSPVAVAYGGSYQAWKSVSPTRILQARPHQNAAAKWIAAKGRAPTMLICHGVEDKVVPCSSSTAFATTWNEAFEDDHQCELKLLDGIGHQDFALDLMFGGPTRNVVMDWILDQLDNDV